MADPDNEVKVQTAFAKLSEGKNGYYDCTQAFNRSECGLHLCNCRRKDCGIRKQSGTHRKERYVL